MAVGDILQVRVVTFTASQVAVNVRHYHVSAQSGTGATAFEIATALELIYAPLYKALMTAGASFRGVGVQKVAPIPPTLEGVSFAQTGTGTVAGDQLPLQVAGLLSFQTQFAGRAFRGRLYIPFAGEDDNALLAQPTAGYQTRMGTLLTAWLAVRNVTGAGGTSTLTPAIYHRATRTFDAITAGFTRSRWATQRRRGDFGRVNQLPF